MKSYTVSLSHSVHGEPESIKVAFLRSDGLVLMDGQLHSTIPHCQIAAKSPLLICEVIDNDSFVDLQEVRNAELE